MYIYIKFYEWIKFFSKKASFFWPIIHHRSWEGFIHPGEELGERLLGHLYGSLLRPRAW